MSSPSYLANPKGEQCRQQKQMKRSTKNMKDIGLKEKHTLRKISDRKNLTNIY